MSYVADSDLRIESWSLDLQYEGTDTHVSSNIQ